MGTQLAVKKKEKLKFQIEVKSFFFLLLLMILLKKKKVVINLVLLINAVLFKILSLHRGSES